MNNVIITIKRNEGVWLVNWDPTFGMFTVGKFVQAQHQVTKRNNCLTPSMHNIIRCFTSRCKWCCRYCTFECKPFCNETFVMHKCLNAWAITLYNAWIVDSHEYPRLATSCLKVKPRIVLCLTSSICLIKQELASKEIETFYHYYKYTALSEVGWNLSGMIKHLLNSTSSNIWLVLPGQGMSSSALLHPTSLVPAKQIWYWTRSRP